MLGPFDSPQKNKLKTRKEEKNMTLAVYRNAQGDRIVISKTEIGIVKENTTVGKHTIYNGEGVNKAKELMTNDKPFDIEYVSWRA